MVAAMNIIEKEKFYYFLLLSNEDNVIKQKKVTKIAI